MKRYIVFIYSLFICYLAAFIGSIFTSQSIPLWYSSLNKPFFNPPNWLFAPVWTILYFLMAICIFMLLTSKSKNKIRNYLISIFYIQLFVNTLWSIFFFGLRSPFLGIIVIVLLLLLIIHFFLKSYKFNKIISYLFIPYILWVSFATILNMAILILN